MPTMQDHIKEVMISKDEIDQRVGELAEDLQKRYGVQQPITMVVVLKGALVFAANLLQRLPMPVRVVVVSASSYQGKTTEPVCRPSVLVPPRFAEQVSQGPVLVVDDILDRGHTLAAVWQMIYKHGGRDVRTCVLLRKRLVGEQQPKVDYVGFDIGNYFVVGYGLDYNELYRNLPDIVVLKPEVYS